MCICRYPRATIIMYNHRNEFLGCAFKIFCIQRYHGIKPKCVTMENLQAKYILKIYIKIIANPVLTFNFQDDCLD